MNRRREPSPCISDYRLGRYLDGAGSARAREVVQRHLEGCASCRDRSAADADPPDRPFATTIRVAFARERRRKRWRIVLPGLVAATRAAGPRKHRPSDTTRFRWPRESMR